MEACSPTKIALNFSELNRTTSGRYRKRASKVHLELTEMIQQQQSNRSTKYSLLRSQSDMKSFRSETSWTEGYSKFLENLDGEEFLKDVPVVESRDSIARSTKSLKARKKRMGRFVTMSIGLSYGFTLKL